MKSKEVRNALAARLGGDEDGEMSHVIGRGQLRSVAALVLAGICAVAVSSGGAQEPETDPMARRYIFGAPAAPHDDWVLAQGGRLYDVWWLVTGYPLPESTHPSYPASGPQRGPVTWRCVECHGWDYRGRDGEYGEGPHATGIKGVDGAAGTDPATIVEIIRDGTHGYSEAMIPADAAMQLAQFVSRGQDDFGDAVDAANDRVVGDPENGRRVFQNVCAICHDYDGRAEITGEEPWLRTLGAVALLSPWQALHKIRNGQPSADMPAMRVFDRQVALDILAYARTLPPQTDD